MADAKAIMDDLRVLAEDEGASLVGVALLALVVDWSHLLLDSQLIPGELRGEVLQNHFYRTCGFEVVNVHLEQIALRLALFLETRGFRTVFLPATYGEQSDWVQRSIPGYFGLFSHRHAAVRAGLGEFGLNNLVVTPNSGLVLGLSL